MSQTIARDQKIPDINRIKCRVRQGKIKCLITEYIMSMGDHRLSFEPRTVGLPSVCPGDATLHTSFFLCVIRLALESMKQ